MSGCLETQADIAVLVTVTPHFQDFAGKNCENKGQGCVWYEKTEGPEGPV